MSWWSRTLLWTFVGTLVLALVLIVLAVITTWYSEPNLAIDHVMQIIWIPEVIGYFGIIVFGAMWFILDDY